MLVGVLRLHLLLPGCRSLKEKRQVLRKIRDRVRNGFEVSLAEVGANESHKHAILGIAAVGKDGSHLHEILDKVERLIVNLYVAEIIDRQTRLLPVDELDTPFAKAL